MDSTDFTVPELKAIAKSKNLRGYSKMNKEELCDLLNIKYIAKTTTKTPIKHKSPPKRIPDCQPINLTYPCKVKKGIFRDEEDWQDYLKLKRKTHTKRTWTREQIAKVANMQLSHQRELLKNKKTPVKKVKFA